MHRMNTWMHTVLSSLMKMNYNNNNNNNDNWMPSLMDIIIQINCYVIFSYDRQTAYDEADIRLTQIWQPQIGQRIIPCPSLCDHFTHHWCNHLSVALCLTWMIKGTICYIDTAHLEEVLQTKLTILKRFVSPTSPPPPRLKAYMGGQVEDTDQTRA